MNDRDLNHGSMGLTFGFFAANKFLKDNRLPASASEESSGICYFMPLIGGLFAAVQEREDDRLLFFYKVGVLIGIGLGIGFDLVQTNYFPENMQSFSM